MGPIAVLNGAMCWHLPHKLARGRRFGASRPPPGQSTTLPPRPFGLADATDCASIRHRGRIGVSGSGSQ
jgi:hypothetical protein